MTRPPIPERPGETLQPSPCLSFPGERLLDPLPGLLLPGGVRQLVPLAAVSLSVTGVERPPRGPCEEHTRPCPFPSSTNTQGTRRDPGPGSGRESRGQRQSCRHGPDTPAHRPLLLLLPPLRLETP